MCSKRDIFLFLRLITYKIYRKIKSYGFKYQVQLLKLDVAILLRGLSLTVGNFAQRFRAHLISEISGYQHVNIKRHYILPKNVYLSYIKIVYIPQANLKRYIWNIYFRTPASVIFITTVLFIIIQKKMLWKRKLHYCKYYDLHILRRLPHICLERNFFGDKINKEWEIINNSCID